MNKELRTLDPDDRKWGAITHFSALIGLLLPLGLVLGPLLVWVLKKNDSGFLDQQGKSAVNFQLTVLIVSFALVLLGMMIRLLIPLAFLAGIAGLVFAVIAGINVLNGKEYRYPWSLHIIK